MAVAQVTSVCIKRDPFEQQHLEHLAQTFPNIKDLYMEWL
jgi:hypothetical protein